MTLVVRRSALKMWLMAMGGIPLLIISLDVLTNRRITNWLRELIFRPEDTQIYEPRDVIWAWAMALFAGFIVLWGLKELFLPTKVIEATDQGLSLKVSGPFRPATVVPWGLIDDIRGIDIEDDGDTIAMLSMRLLSRGDLPDNPWGARWVGERELALLAEDWSESPQEIADQLVGFAVDAARREAKARTKSIWQEGEAES
jgi:hypothetical protein